MIDKDIQYDFDDLVIVPATKTNIFSRNLVNIKYGNDLPLMTAPMDTVIGEKNKHIFSDLGIIPVLPRINPSNLHDEYYSYEHFLSYSLKDVENIFLINKVNVIKPKKIKILIDIANGHMTDLMEVVKKLKDSYGDDILLMVGNVANPTTMDIFYKLKVDYVRLGIGNGEGCLTTKNTGVGSSLVYLIQESYKIRQKFYDDRTKIVADGGFKNYSDIIKALGLGADYVMLGSIFNKALESIGETSTEIGTIVDQFSDETKDMYLNSFNLYKNFRGMSTKEAQKALGQTTLKTSEGVVRRRKVEYLLSGWVENFEHYLKSAMSYTNTLNLEEFKGKVNFSLITQNAFNRFNK